MMKDVNAEKSKLTGIVESMKEALTQRDGEVHSLKCEVSRHF